MDAEMLALCSKLVPGGYVQQGAEARKSRQNKIRHLLEQVSTLQIN